MNPDLKQKWIDALRSGKYEQGQGSLRSSNNRFCCLGVLCDIYDDSKWKDIDGEGDCVFYFADGDKRGSFLPEVIGRSTGVGADHQTTLANMNDHGESFTEIADYIEENL